MPVPPASVRLSLWTTAAWNGTSGTTSEPPLRAALRTSTTSPETSDASSSGAAWASAPSSSPCPRRATWTGMPAASPDAQGGRGGGRARVRAEHGRPARPDDRGLRSPGGGSALDTGNRVDWRAFDADPVPRHRVEALSEPSQLERHLRQELLRATEALEDLGGLPFAAEAAREVADAALGRVGAAPGLPSRALRAITLAGLRRTGRRLALDGPDDALEASTACPCRSLPAAAPAARRRPGPGGCRERRVRRAGLTSATGVRTWVPWPTAAVSKVQAVQAWHEAVNAGDVEAAVALCAADVAVTGPRGVGHGHDLMRAWLTRSGIRLEPQHLREVDGHAFVHEHAQWTAARRPRAHPPAARSTRGWPHRRGRSAGVGQPLRENRGRRAPGRWRRSADGLPRSTSR